MENKQHEVSNSALKSANFCEEFIQIFLDADKRPSRGVIRERGWKCIPIADFINPMEADWAAKAIRQTSSHDVVALSYEAVGQCETQNLEISGASIVSYFAGNSHKYSAITDKIYSFLIFKDQLNRYFLLCGSNDFLSLAYRSSIEIAKQMYFEQWIDANEFTDAEKRYLESTWRYYVD